MKVEAKTIDLGDVILDGKKQYRVVGKHFNSGGLGDSVWFKLYNSKTDRYMDSGKFDHDCLLDVKRS